ncbi:hypothetical protein GCM10022286_16970 [Gryllotalpicola daejeonensis]|uniref:Class F sortase n=1 Tax=Gryllotalpicola daejeonensis TaxID=993087 RepID=A0ABP7ZJS5_9MICO
MTSWLHKPRILWVALAGILAITVGATWAITASLSPPAAGSLTDMTGKHVALDPGTLPPAKVRKQMHAIADTGPRFRVPSVGLNVPLGAISVAGGQLTPPGFTSVYAVRNLGTTRTAPGKGTLYVVTHSLRGGGKAPGNYLTDISRQQAAVKPGDVVFVGSTEYTIATSTLVKKTDIAAQNTLWANTPNRLAIITCLEKPTGVPSTDNLIIYAKLKTSATP